MKPHIAEVVDLMIDAYGLHEDVTAPVPIFNLEPVFPVVRRDLDHMGIAGMVILPRELPVTECNFARVVLSDALDDDDERLVYAHEVAHGIMGHEGELRVSDMDSWFTDRSERQAWQIAARLLIPPSAWLDRGDVQRMAAAFRVPTMLVRWSYA